MAYEIYFKRFCPLRILLLESVGQQRQRAHRHKTSAFGIRAKVIHTRHTGMQVVRK